MDNIKTNLNYWFDGNVATGRLRFVAEWSLLSATFYVGAMLVYLLSSNLTGDIRSWIGMVSIVAGLTYLYMFLAAVSRRMNGMGLSQPWAYAVFVPMIPLVFNEFALSAALIGLGVLMLAVLPLRFHKRNQRN